jgi:hypothetical protein
MRTDYVIGNIRSIDNLLETYDAVFVATEIKRKYKSMSDRTSPRMAKNGAKIGPDRP